ncbi:MAG: HDOD domain-containing protein [Planctomycetes bacterium]|nr:HDOD domain-containing protein [Planctomycetota bacterium]
MSQSVTPETLKAADKLIGKIDQLHSSPQISQKILSLTKNPDYNLNEVTKWLENDPAMTARILRTVNSSRYGLRHKVTNVKQAAAYIGQRSLRLITLTFGLVETLTRGVSSNLYMEYWRRALTMATVSSHFVTAEKKTSMEDRYTAGLLADTGVLVFAQIHKDEYAELFESVDHGPELLELEQQQFGCDHATLGARLLENWELPETLVTAVMHHHEDREEASPLEIAIRIGDIMADALWKLQPGHIARAKSFLQSELRYDTDDFIEFALVCRDEVTENAEMFGIKLNEMIDTDQFITETLALADEEALVENAS